MNYSGQDKAPAIMVIDDSPIALKISENMLTSIGYNVVCCMGGKAAIEQMRKTMPDLILMDITMPEMSGLEVCALLKHDKQLSEIPIIFISAHGSVADKLAAFEVGGVDYITKPFYFEEVQSRVKTHLRLRSMQQELEMHNNHLQLLVEQKVMEITEAQMATIFALAELAESRDDDTGRHIKRTARYCELLARRLLEIGKHEEFQSPTYIRNLLNSVQLHDIGKVGISDAILLKPGKLTEAEYNVMKTHTFIGEMTLSEIHRKYPKNDFIKLGMLVTRSHHEKWDGSGYPDGLKGRDIPLVARIMSVADVYDALRAQRVYKAALSHQESCKIIQEGAGIAFDPDIVSAFMDSASDFDSIQHMLSDWAA